MYNWLSTSSHSMSLKTPLTPHTFNFFSTRKLPFSYLSSEFANGFVDTYKYSLYCLDCFFSAFYYTVK